MLKITNLKAYYQDQAIVKGVSLTLNRGEIVILMGPNGSGKSTLANAIMGHPHYTVKAGQINLDGQDITKALPEDKVNQGLFLAWQNPMAVSGVSLTKLIRELDLFKDDITTVVKSLRQYAKKLNFSDGLLLRGLNDGFSGGERKKLEMLQAVLLAKKYVLFDEIDTGLDVDALKAIAKEINILKHKNLGCLVITHYHRLIKLLEFDKVVVMRQGKVIKTGGRALAEKIENHGYTSI